MRNPLFAIALITLFPACLFGQFNINELPFCSPQAVFISDIAADGTTKIYSCYIQNEDAVLHLLAELDTEVHIAFNPTDNLLYTVEKWGGAFRTFDPYSAYPLPSASNQLNNPITQVTAAAFSEDGTLLLGSQNQNKIYSVNTTSKIISLYDAYAPLEGGDLAFTPYGMLYMATREGNGLYEVYPEAVQQDQFLNHVPGQVTGLTYFQDQLLVSYVGASALSVFNIDGSEYPVSFPLILDGESHTLQNGDLASGCAPASFPNFEGCQDYRYYYVSNNVPGQEQGSVYELSITGNDAVLSPLFSTGFRAHIAVNTDLNHLYAANTNGTEVLIFDQYGIEIGQQGLSLPSVESLVYDPVAQMLYAGSDDSQTIYSIDPSTGLTAIYADNLPLNGGDLVLSPQGDLYLIERNDNAPSILYVIEDGSAVLVNNVAPAVNGAAYTADGGLIMAQGAGASFFHLYNSVGEYIGPLNAVDMAGLPFTLEDGDMASGCYDIPPTYSSTQCQTITAVYADTPEGTETTTLYRLESSIGAMDLIPLTTVDYKAEIAVHATLQIVFLVNPDALFVEYFDMPINDIIHQIPIQGNIDTIGAVAFNESNGLLYITEESQGKIYTLNPFTGATFFVANAPINGGDLMIDDGVLHLSRKDPNELYRYENGAFHLVGNLPVSSSGLGLFENGNYLISSSELNGFMEISSIDASMVQVFAPKVDNQLFTMGRGDLGSGCQLPIQGIPDRGACYATEYLDYEEGVKSNGTPINVNRTDPQQSLGEPEAIDGMVFTTLGYGGSIVLNFDGAVYNEEGPDLEFVETSFNSTGCEAYPEYADISVSVDGITYFYAGTVCKSNPFIELSDAGIEDFILYVKVENNDELTSTPDGYDLDGVIALHNCSPEDEAALGREAVPPSASLSSYPNPVIESVQISFEVPVSAAARLEIYNASGVLIAELYWAMSEGGIRYQTTFNVAGYPPGVYICRLSTAYETVIEKIVITK